MRLLAFARLLRARWDRRVISPRPLGLVFRQPHAPQSPRPRQGDVTHTHLRRDVHLELRPNISLTLVRSPAAARASRARELVSSTSSAFERTDVTNELVLCNTSVRAAERLVERALSRSRRVDVLVRPGPAGRLAAEAHRPSMPPPLVVRHAASEPRPSGDGRRDAAPAAQPAPGWPAPAEMDLGRLTDHVVTAIDNRLAAHAERLGRG